MCINNIIENYRSNDMPNCYEILVFIINLFPILKVAVCYWTIDEEMGITSLN